MTTIDDRFKEQLRLLLTAPEAIQLIEALDTPPVTGVRLNPHKPAVLFPDARSVAWCADGFTLPERPRFAAMPQWHAGAFYVQEPASMITQSVVAELLPRLGDGPMRYLDSCAAPGGKTTAAISALRSGDFAVANEFVASRANILMENLLKWGFPGVAVTQGDTAAYGRLRDCFDIVAVDAPCSGEGMMRKEEEARRQWSPGLVSQCAALQREILENVWPALRPGGYLIYSTCTFNRTENEDMLAFIRDSLGGKPVDLGFNDRFGIPASLDPALPAMRFMPHRTEGEGLFMGVMRKPGEATRHLSGKKTDKKRKGGKREDDMDAEAKRWLSAPDDYRFMPDGDRWLAVPVTHADLAESLRKVTRVLTAGVPVGVQKGKSIVPEPALALSTGLAEDAFPCVELTADEAQSYLRREALTLPGSAPRGYVIVRHGGLPLGFVKNLGKRANNLYPQHWRLRT